jgi:hypothetical protein
MHLRQPSTPFHLILRLQQVEKRLDARRATAGLALANARERNNADGRLSACPKGVPPIRQCGVAVLGKEGGHSLQTAPCLGVLGGL